MNRTTSSSRSPIGSSSDSGASCRRPCRSPRPSAPPKAPGRRAQEAFETPGEVCLVVSPTRRRHRPATGRRGYRRGRPPDAARHVGVGGIPNGVRERARGDPGRAAPICAAAAARVGACERAGVESSRGALGEPRRPGPSRSRRGRGPERRADRARRRREPGSASSASSGQARASSRAETARGSDGSVEHRPVDRRVRSGTRRARRPRGRSPACGSRRPSPAGRRGRRAAAGPRPSAGRAARACRSRS